MWPIKWVTNEEFKEMYPEKETSERSPVGRGVMCRLSCGGRVRRDLPRSNKKRIIKKWFKRTGKLKIHASMKDGYGTRGGRTGYWYKLPNWETQGTRIEDYT